MDEAWQILRDGGLPLATERSGQRRTAEELARATRDAIAGSPTGRDADALAAFVLAWLAHWPASFARVHGPGAAEITAWARGACSDENRYLKLRRIAIENLATVL